MPVPTYITRTGSAEVARIDEITSGPKAAAYLERGLPDRMLRIEDLGDYALLDREIEPARTTAKSATSANCYDNGDPSTRAMSADLLLASRPDRRPTVGEVKVSTAKGDDADAFYALIQALALAAQLVGETQRQRLLKWYDSGRFADSGAIDVLVLDFQLGQRPGRQTLRPTLKSLAIELCALLDGAVPHLNRVALVDVLPHDGELRFVHRSC